MTTKEVNNKLNDLYEEMFKIALAEVERLARKLMKEHKELDEFIMSVGVYGFIQKGSGEILCYGTGNGTNDRKYMKPLYDFMERWNQMLYLSGQKMRFTADGEVVVDW